MEMYASYGVLTHEKHPVYSLSVPASEIYDTFDLTLPDGWRFCESTHGDTLIESPDGTLYLWYDILTNFGDHPVLRWYDGYTERRVDLTKYAIKR